MVWFQSVKTVKVMVMAMILAIFFFPVQSVPSVITPVRG